VSIAQKSNRRLEVTFGDPLKTLVHIVNGVRASGWGCKTCWIPNETLPETRSMKGKSMENDLSASARRVQQALADKGLQLKVVELPGSTRTAGEAAQAVGCGVAQIAKSLVFRGKQSGAAVLVIASGANRVDEKKLARLLAEAVEKPNAEYVRQVTGFVIGGVPPVAHEQPLRTFIDPDLLEHAQIWAAAGTPHALFALTPADLLKMTAGQVAEIKV
jgi:prolyl-tRNA editing enzyme YbaK/EbsC (Cys-tRNA(Pro) deacylase)